MPKTIEGICKLCGIYGKLTFEHVPPASVFNNTAVLNYPPEVTVEMLSGSNGRIHLYVEPSYAKTEWNSGLLY